jgi:two-component system sensor kinase FixL
LTITLKTKPSNLRPAPIFQRPQAIFRPNRYPLKCPLQPAQPIIDNTMSNLSSLQRLAAFHPGKRVLIPLATLLIALIAFTDWVSTDNIPLGFLYLVPMLLLGRILKPWQTILTAGLCTLLAELFDPFDWNLRVGIPRDTLYFAAFAAIGIFVYTANRNRHTILAQLAEIERQSAARQDAEEQLKVLIETSPAAILTTDAEGAILMANSAAHRMLALPAGTLPGRTLQPFFPALANISRSATTGHIFRAVMESRGHREDGETFMAEICFSTYTTNAGARLAALVLDASEELRTREEAGMHQVLAGSRIAVGAVSHEIRNVCGAISVVHQNLARNQLLRHDKDFEALGNLVSALEKIASVDLLQYPDSKSEVDLLSVLHDLKIVITPSLQEHEILARWTLPRHLPPIWADRTSLMQIFLNLTTNSIRALTQRPPERLLAISTAATSRNVIITFLDNAGGVPHPEELFRPFQAGSHSTGLGLYLSRAFARSFGGDVLYKPTPGHACFMVDLPILPQQDDPQ